MEGRETESTMKWKVDVTQLSKGMQEAKRAISLANAEFKNATAGLGKWSTSVTGVEAKLKQLTAVSKNQKTVLATLEKQYDIVAKEMGEASPEAQRLKIQIENQKAAIAKTESQLGTYNDKLDELKAEQEAAQSPMGKLNSKIEEQEKELEDLKDEYKNAVLEFGKTSDEAEDLAKEIKDLSSDLAENKSKMNDASDSADELDESLRDVGDEANSTSNGGLNTFAVALGNLAANLISSVISKMEDLITETFEVGQAFETSMAKVQALSGASGDELELLKNTAKEFGSTTQFSATEAADALGYMALAGWDAQQSSDALGGVLSLAAASGMDLAKASDMVTDYLSAFGMQAEDSAYFADMLAYAQANSNTSAEQLGEAYKNCAANMNAAGQDVETTTSLLAMLANQGLKGSEAGTALSAVMRDMTSKMEDGAIKIGETSVQVMDANGNYRDMTDILADVEAATQGMGDAEKAAALQSTFTSDSIKGLNLILNAGVDEAAGFEDALRDSGGSAEDMATIMNDNLSGDLTALGSKLEGIQLTVYEKFEPALRKGAEVLDKLLDAVDFVVDHSAEFIAVLAGMGAGIAAYVAYTTALTVMREGWMALTIVQKAVTAAQWLMNAAMAANPIGIVIALIAALVVAFILLWNKSEGFREFWIGLWEKVKEVCETVINAVVGFFTETVPEALETMITFFSELPGKILEFLTEVLTAVGEWAISMSTKALEAGQTFLENVVNFIKNLPKNIATFLTNVINTVITWAANMGKRATEAGRNFLQNVVNFIKNLPGRIAGFLAQVISNLATWVGNMGKKGTEAAKSLFNNVVNGLASLPGKMLNIGKDIVKGLWNGISNMTEWIIGKIQGFGDSVLSGIKKFFGINSPSRLMRDEIGKFLPEGIAVGFEAQLPKSMKKIQGELSASVNGLKSNIVGSAASINGSVTGSSVSSALVGGQTITFNQTINSPKAVDRLTLYRQTNSLLFNAKVGLSNV